MSGKEVNILTRVPKEVRLRLKKIALNREISLNKLMIEAIELIIKKYEKKNNKEIE